MEEIWKDVPSYEGYYQASNLGRIRSYDRIILRPKGNYLKKGRILKPQNGTNGYHVISLRKNKIGGTVSLHRIIASTFIPNPENKKCVNHINGNKKDNNINNLEWTTYSENIKHAFKNKLNKGLKGEKKPISKLKNKEVLDIKKMLGKGLTNVEIAKTYNVDARTISCIKTGVSWSWLTGIKKH